MKAMNLENGSRRPEQPCNSLYSATSSSRLEAGVFATLGLVGFVAVLIAFASAFSPADEDLTQYVRSGRFTADARTWLATVRYLLEPEPAAVTNVIDNDPIQKSAAAPTNIHRPQSRAELESCRMVSGPRSFIDILALSTHCQECSHSETPATGSGYMD
jgi:hypothetical protein